MYDNLVKIYYDKIMLESITEETTSLYADSLNEKQNDKIIWNSIKKEIQLEYPKHNLRDITNKSHLHCYALQFSNADNTEGLVVYLSYYPKLIGVYFCDYKINSLIPYFKDSYSFNPHISFFPFNKIQIEQYKSLIKIIRNHRLEFNLFNNLYAEDEYEEIVIDGSICKKSILFEIVFDHNLTAIF